MRRTLTWTARILIGLALVLAAFVGYLYAVTNREIARRYDVKVPAVAIPRDAASVARDQFVAAIREHKRPNGSTISDVMPRAYGQMSKADLHDIQAFLRTVPAAGAKMP